MIKKNNRKYALNLNLLSRQDGYIALVSVLIVSAVTLAIAISTALSGIEELKMSFRDSHSSEALSFADSCVDESLNRLRLNWGNDSGSINFNGNTCDFTISATSNAYITASSTVDEYTRTIEVETDSNLNIVSWREK